jgi:hypothetical protein
MISAGDEIRCGITNCCIGVGVSKPISVTARVNSALIESVEKEIISKNLYY